MATIDLIGGFVLSTGEGSVRLPHTSLRLLSFLCLRGPRVTRNEAATALWPDHGEARARSNLRAAVWRMGPTADLVLESCDETIAVKASTTVDIVDLRSACLPMLRADRINDELGQNPKLLAELLPQITDEWAEVSRERWRQLRLHVLNRYLDQLCDDARPASAVALSASALVGASAHETLRCRADRAGRMVAAMGKR